MILKPARSISSMICAANRPKLLHELFEILLIRLEAHAEVEIAPAS